MKQKIFLISLFLFILMISSFATPAEDGKIIFSTRCAGCHNINKLLTGPALAGVDERRSIDWIIKFVHSSQTLIKSGDKDAVALFEKFNKIPMPDHPDLTPENIKSIVAYIKSESSSSIDKPPFTKPEKLHPAYTPVSVRNYGFFISFLLGIGLLIAVMLFAVQVKSMERK